MTNKEAIKIVEDMIESMNDIDVLYAHEQDALNQLIKTAKECDAIKKDYIENVIRTAWGG